LTPRYPQPAPPKETAALHQAAGILESPQCSVVGRGVHHGAAAPT
jgi:hypothetical protein